MTSIILYTIGHSNIAAPDFLALLKQHGIRVLVDVRSAPYSKYVPHFNKRELEAFLKENGVDYRYAGEYLGGRPPDAEAYKGGEVPDEDTRREQFLKLVDYPTMMKREGYQKGLDRLLDIVRATDGGVAIMCSEGDPHDCHRHHLITRSLLDPQVKVVDAAVEVRHILKDGALEVVDPSEFEEPPQQLPLL
jgi:uncharacterized protein (DUF488 family)